LIVDKYGEAVFKFGNDYIKVTIPFEKNPYLEKLREPQKEPQSDVCELKTIDWELQDVVQKVDTDFSNSTYEAIELIEYIKKLMLGNKRISKKDICAITGKSISTIKRILKEIGAVYFLASRDVGR